jgi:hypothetical protein
MEIFRRRIWALFVAAALAGGCEQGEDFEQASEQDDEILEEPLFEPEPPPKIAGVEIIEYPNLTFFAKNQPFSYEGLVLRFVMDNGEYGRNVESSEYTVKPVDTSTPRSDVVDVTVNIPTEDAVHDEGYTADSVTYNVRYGIEIDHSTLILSEIQLVSPPSKTAYKLGEKFSVSGLTITGRYFDSETGGYGDKIEVNAAAVSVSGYDRRLRGAQQVKLKFNGTVITTMDVAVRVPAEAAVTVNSLGHQKKPHDQYTGSYRTTYIKGMGYDFAKSNLKVNVKLNNETFQFNNESGLSAGDITGYNPNAEGGKQTLTVKVDDASAAFDVYLADVEPHVYFDYGFMRTSIDPLGVMPGGGYADSSRTAGRLAAAVNEKLVLAPVRFLIGYGADNQDLGVTCTWSVSGPSTYTASHAGEFLYFTPTAAGDYDITVNVTGRGFVDGGTITRSAAMRVACYQGTQPAPSGNTYKDPLRNYGCGQYSESGNGYGWSCGSALGYIVWNGGTSIVGNQFASWNEPGIIWVQGDGNGNGIPDEKWLEKTGSDDGESSPYKSLVSRRYAIAYFLGSGDAAINEYNQTIRDVYWVDGKGRNGRIPGGWPKDWGVPGHTNSRVIYTGTILRDNGGLGSGNYSAAGLGTNYFGVGYVDAGESRTPSGNYPNIYADGSRDGLPPASAVPLAGSQQLLSVSGGGGFSPSVSSAGLPALTGPVASKSYSSFIKVQTAIFVYGSIYGDVSTEVKEATGLPDQSNGFPDP